MAHRIALRGFWARRPGGPGAVYERAFGRPRRSDAAEEWWLVGGPFPCEAAVSVNGAELARLPAGEALAARLPDDLPARNRAAVALADDADWAGELAVEIRGERGA